MTVASLFLLPLLLALCSSVNSQSFSVPSSVVAGTAITGTWQFQIPPVGTVSASLELQWRNSGTGATGALVDVGTISGTGGQATIVVPNEPGTYVIDVFLPSVPGPAIATSNSFQVVAPPPPQTTHTTHTTTAIRSPSTQTSQPSPGQGSGGLPSSPAKSLLGGNNSLTGGASGNGSGGTNSASTSDSGSNLPTSDILDASFPPTNAVLATIQESMTDSSSTDTPQISNNDSAAGPSLALKPIIGGAAGGVALVLISISLILICRRRRRMPQRITQSDSFYDGQSREMEGYERSSWRARALTETTTELLDSESEYSSQSRRFTVISSYNEPSPSWAQGSDPTLLEHTPNVPPLSSLPRLVLNPGSYASVSSPLTPQLPVPLTPLRRMPTPENEEFYDADDESAPFYSQNTVMGGSYLGEGSSSQHYSPQKSRFREGGSSESHLSPVNRPRESVSGSWRASALTDPTSEMPNSESEHSSHLRRFTVIPGSNGLQGPDAALLEHTPIVPLLRSPPRLVLNPGSSASVSSPLIPQLPMPLSPLRRMPTPENEEFFAADDKSASSCYSQNTVMEGSYLGEDSSSQYYSPQRSGFQEAGLSESYISPANRVRESISDISSASSPTAFAPRRQSLSRVRRLHDSQLDRDLSFVLTPVGGNISSHPESEREGTQSRNRYRETDAGPLDFPEQPPRYDEVFRPRTHDS